MEKVGIVRPDLPYSLQWQTPSCYSTLIEREIKHFLSNCKPARQLTAQPSFPSRLSSFDRVMSRESHPLLTRFTRPTSSLTKPNYLILPSRAKVGYARVPSYLLQISDFNLPMFGLPHAHTFVLSFVFLKFTFKFNLFIFVFDFFG